MKKEESYLPRLIDSRISKSLQAFGAVSVEGPRWCGKTQTGLMHSRSVSSMSDQNQRNLAQVDPRSIFLEEKPQLIDEWQAVPTIWDAVGNECGHDQKIGQFILTNSVSPGSISDCEISLSSTGRIAMLRMDPMSLFESGDSSGEASISNMLNGTLECKHSGQVDLRRLAYLIVRGGWPENIGVSEKDVSVLPSTYLEAILHQGMHEGRDVRRNPERMRSLLCSLARNESSVIGNAALIRDMAEHENRTQIIESRVTIADYLGVLDSLYLTANQEAYSLNYRSSTRVGKTAKRHLVDPSLCCASLNLSPEKLLLDFETFGLLFEALVERDLRIYAHYLDGHLFHFCDNQSGDEVDAIMEFRDGDYAAFEIKLTTRGIDDALQSLSKFYENVEKKPAFMCVVVGHCEAIMRDPDTGIYIVPATTLKP